MIHLSYIFDAQLVLNASGDSVGRFLREKERIRKSRFTCLESQSKDFSGVLAVLNDLRVFSRFCLLITCKKFR